MKQVVKYAAVAIVAAQAIAAAQTKTADQVLADARRALGGDKLAAVRTVSGNGRTLRTAPNGTSVENEFELAMELPDKYRMRSVLMAMGNMSIFRHTGFNGGQVIDEVDRPPNLSGGNVVIRMAGPGGGTIDPEKMTPEQKAEADRMRLLANKKEFTRLMLGFLAGSTAAYPLEFTYAGEAESAEGKADVIDIKGEGDFQARLFIDQTTHHPLMLSWMDKEPLVLRMGGQPGAMAGAGGNVQTFSFGGGSAGGARMSKEEMEKFQAEMEAKRKEAEANRRTVEYRVFYGDYRSIGGVTWPHRIQRSIDGKPTEEMIFDTLKVNPKVDAKLFQVSK